MFSNFYLLGYWFHLLLILSVSYSQTFPLQILHVYTCVCMHTHVLAHVRDSLKSNTVSNSDPHFKESILPRDEGDQQDLSFFHEIN